MGERQPGRVQERTLQPHHRAQIAGDPPVYTTVDGRRPRVPNRAEVHADLMGAAGGDRHLEQRHALQWRAQVTRVTALRARRARVDIFWRCAGSRPIAASMRVPPERRPTPARRTPFDLAVPELARQLLVRAIVLRDDHQARGPAIEPVHDSRTQLAADAARDP